MSRRETADFLPPDAMAGLQAERWRAQRRHVMENSPFFRRLWAGRPVPERLDDLPALPLCDKAMLRDSQAAAPPFGDYLAVPAAQVSRLHRTSGTSGQAMNLALSAADARQTAEVGGRAQRAAGLKPGQRVIHCLNYQMWMGGVSDHMTLEAAGATVIPFGVGDSALLVRTIRELAVTAISCTPSYPAVLEKVIAERFPGLAPCDLELELGLFGGEAGLDDRHFRDRLEATWGFKARNANYGVSDVFCNLAGQCARNDDLHFVALDVLAPEIIDPQTTEVLPWRDGAEGELVLTHLRRECQPLVRFRTGDIVRLTETDRCVCGRWAPRFRVIGRSDDMVTVRGINVFPTGVAAVVNAIAELSGEYRIVLATPPPHHRLPLEVELAPGRAATPELAAKVAEAVRRHLQVTAEVTLLPAGSLPRTAGKTRRVIR